MTTWTREETLTTSTEGALQLNNTLTVGANTDGHDVKFFGCDSGHYMLWDESSEQLRIVSPAARASIVLECTDDSDTNGPGFQFYRNSATPEGSSGEYDTLGSTSYLGRNADNNADVNYTRVRTRILDPTTGAEEGEHEIDIMANGTLRKMIEGKGQSDDTVDVSIGHGAGSTTTIAGDLTVTGGNITVTGAPDWTVSNKSGTPRALNANGTLAEIGDNLAQLVDDLISIGILQ